MRGTGQSEGSWEAFGETEQADYAEVVDWAASQSFSNGRIGLYGVSYLGITAMLTAAQNHPAVKAAFPIVPIGDGYRDIVFTGGQVNVTFIPLWLGLISILGITNPTALTNPAIGVPVLLDHLTNAVTDFQVPTILRAVAADLRELERQRTPVGEVRNRAADRRPLPQRPDRGRCLDEHHDARCRPVGQSR